MKGTFLYWLLVVVFALSVVETRLRIPDDINPAEKVTRYHDQYGADDAEWARRLLEYVSSLPHDVRIVLDAGGSPSHGEVFYSIANLVTELLPKHDITFYISALFSTAARGLEPFWDKYRDQGPIRDFKYKMVTLMDHPSLELVCNRTHGWSQPYVVDNATNEDLHFHMRVHVTIYNTRSVSCVPVYTDDPHYIFIVHHAEQERPHHLLSAMRNVYFATDSEGVKKITNNHFTPSLMPIAATPPDCTQPPLFIIQGGLNRRNLSEVESVLKDASLNVRVRVVSLSKPPAWMTKDKRVSVVKDTDMTVFHEQFVGAAFILPLIVGADDGSDPEGYLHDHPTSNIAYSAHFELRVVGHTALLDAYPSVLQGRRAHYFTSHDQASVIQCYTEAVSAFEHYCESALSLKKSAHPPTQNHLVNLWAYGSLIAPPPKHTITPWE